MAKFFKPFNSLSPHDIIYKVSIQEKKAYKVLVKECVKDGMGKFSIKYRLIIYTHKVLSTEKLKEAITSPEYVRGTIPETHIIVDGTQSEVMFSTQGHMFFMCTSEERVKSFMKARGIIHEI